MKNKLIDLNNHLFAQLERLGAEDISQEEIEKEIMRTDAIVSVAGQIISNAEVSVKAATLAAQYAGKYNGMLPMIESRLPDHDVTVINASDRIKEAKPGKK